MKLSEIGGEFGFIKRVTGVSYKDPAIVKGVGDDCAVLEYTKDRYLLVTVDMMVENSHFSLAWQSPYQVGKKLVEVNVSDIISMGGSPRYAFISLALTGETQVEQTDELYRGIYDSAGRHGVALIGGDTTRGRELVLNLAVLGDVEKEHLRLRGHASPGELLCVTGTLGKSEAGLQLLLQKKSGYTAGYLEPVSRLEWEGKAIARCARAMIDVSDGLASEVGHICEESGTGARIDCEKIPLSGDTIEAARIVGGDPYRYALNGGEDFELVFSIAKEDIARLRREFNDFTVVGEILKKEEGVRLVRDGKELDLAGGFDHFAG